MPFASSPAAFAATVLLLTACSVGPDRICAGYCESELECGRIDREQVSACVTSCRGHVAGSTQECGVAFVSYARCYDDSRSCAATDCFDSFRVFADNCDWHADEVSLSAEAAADRDGAADAVSARDGSPAPGGAGRHASSPSTPTPAAGNRT